MKFFKNTAERFFTAGACKLIIACAWIFLFKESIAQVTFNKMYNIDTGVEIAQSAVELADGYLFYGEGSEYPELPLDRMMVLFKTDLEGNVLWQKKYGKEYESWYSRRSCLVLLPDSNIAMWGNIFDYNISKHIATFIKFNKYGDTISIKRFEEVNDNKFLAGVRHPSGEFYFAGITRNYGDLNGDVWLVKTDNEGNILWERKYGGNKIDESNNIALTANGNLMIGANTEKFGNKSFAPWVIELDTSGNIIWDGHFGTQQGNDCGAFVLPLNDGSYIVETCLDTLGLPPYFLTNSIIKINANNEVVWRKILGATVRDETIRMRKQTSDGNVVFAGEIKNDDKKVGWFFKLDTDGNMIWERIINTPYNKIAAIYDFQETSDGGFICTGNGVGLYNHSDFWLLKLDEYGCDTTNCITSVETLAHAKHEVYLFPNPATDKVFVSIKSSNKQHAYKESQLKLYDVSGKEIYTQTSTLNSAAYSEYYINTTNFQQGIYFYTVTTGNEITGKGKLIVQ